MAAQYKNKIGIKTYTTEDEGSGNTDWSTTTQRSGSTIRNCRKYLENRSWRKENINSSNYLFNIFYIALVVYRFFANYRLEKRVKQQWEKNDSIRANAYFVITEKHWPKSFLSVLNSFSSNRSLLEVATFKVKCVYEILVQPTNGKNHKLMYLVFWRIK